MREHPTGANLLATARAEFETRLLPKLDGADRHTARMILRAIDLALREMGDAEVNDRHEMEALRRLQPLYAPTQAVPPQDGEEALAHANRLLVDAIRSGHVDPGTPARAAVLDHLKSVAQARLKISDPRKLHL